jgi:hypothetical protein
MTKPQNISQSAWDKMTEQERATWLRASPNIGRRSSTPFTAIIPGRLS